MPGASIIPHWTGLISSLDDLAYKKEARRTIRLPSNPGRTSFKKTEEETERNKTVNTYPRESCEKRLKSQV